MDKDRICKIVEDQEELTTKRLATQGEEEDDIKFCVIGACLHDLGIPVEAFAGFGTPGCIYLTLDKIPDEVLEEFPDRRILPAEGPDLPRSVNAETLLRYVFDMSDAEVQALMGANDASSREVPEEFVDVIENLSGATPRERVLEFLNCQGAI